MHKLGIVGNNPYDVYDTAAIRDSLPYDIKMATEGDVTLRWGKDIVRRGDKLMIRGEEYNLPIRYQLLRFRHGAISPTTGRERCRWFNLRAQMMIPMGVWVIGYVGTAKEFYKFTRKNPDMYYLGIIVDEENIPRYEWTINARTIAYPTSESIRATFYRSCDIIIDNPEWARPRIEAIACGVPVASARRVFSKRSDKTLYDLLKPLNNDTVYEHDRSYFIAKLTEQFGWTVDQPLISICINIYNREHLIAYAIESALRQSYPNIELILVDDASSDRSVEIAEQYAEMDDRVKLVVLDKNVGCPASWSKSMELARGQLLTYTSSDNIQDYGQLWHLNRFWQQERCDIVYGKPRYFGGTNRKVYSHAVNRNLALSCAGLGPSFLLPRWLVDESDLMHSEDLYVEDTSMTADMCTMGAVVSRYPGEYLYYYRDSDPTSLTSKVRQMGGYKKLLMKMGKHRTIRRNEAVRRLQYIHIRDVDDITTLRRALSQLGRLGMKATIVGDDKVRGAFRNTVGINNVKLKCEDGKCEWGYAAISIDSMGIIYRCPYRNVRRGAAYSDFFLNNRPRPCYKCDECG